MDELLIQKIDRYINRELHLYNLDNYENEIGITLLVICYIVIQNIVSITKNNEQLVTSSIIDSFNNKNSISIYCEYELNNISFDSFIIKTYKSKSRKNFTNDLIKKINSTLNIYLDQIILQLKQSEKNKLSPSDFLNANKQICSKDVYNIVKKLINNKDVKTKLHSTKDNVQYIDNCEMAKYSESDNYTQYDKDDIFTMNLTLDTDINKFINKSKKIYINKIRSCDNQNHIALFDIISTIPIN